MKVISPLLFSFVVQLCICATLTLSAGAWGWLVAYSTGIGALLFIVPNLYFTYYAFRFRGTELTRWIKKSFMFGEYGKLSLTGLGFALVFVFIRPLHVGALFTGYVVMIISQWWIARRIASTEAAKKPSRGG